MTALRLTRSRQDVKSFLSVLGGLRETRLTAVLGYLAARFPREFGKLLGFETTSADEISVEEAGNGDRYDVLIRASGETHIIEGKIGPHQNTEQLLRYIRSFPRKPFLTVVDDGSEYSLSRERDFAEIKGSVQHLKFVTWAKVARTCEEVGQFRRTRKRDLTAAIIAQEFFLHLQENNMTEEPRPEIYLRDVSTINSVKLFFRHHIYKCQPSFFNSARRNLYFAPYFTRPTAEQVREENLVPLGEGISFIAKIEKTQLVDIKDVLTSLRAENHSSPEEATKLIREHHKENRVLLMTLGTPRLMFVSPITKAKLRTVNPTYTNGAMGSRSCTFDLLLEASS